MADDSITLDGQILNGSDRFGEWKTHSIGGWWESPDPKDQDEERPLSDGDNDLEVFYKARYVTLSGRLLARDHSQLHEAVDRFTGLVQKRARLQISGHGSAQWATVKRASGLVMTPATDTFAHWQARLKAPDPRKFGTTREEELISGQSRTLVHYGNAMAAPLVVINGPLTGGYTLSSNEGRVYRVNAGIAAGSTHSVDMNDGLLRVNGKVQAGLVGRADIWDIPPGLLPDGSTLNMALFPDSGTATGRVYITDTSI